MLHWLISLGVSALLLLVVSRLVRGFEVDGCGTAIIAALVVGFINATLGPLLRFFAFPITLLTLGLFLLVINAVLLQIAAVLVPGFRIRGFGPALVAALLLSLANVLLGR